MNSVGIDFAQLEDSYFAKMTSFTTGCGDIAMRPITNEAERQAASDALARHISDMQVFHNTLTQKDNQRVSTGISGTGLHHVEASFHEGFEASPR